VGSITSFSPEWHTHGHKATGRADAIAAAAGRRAGRVLAVTDPTARMDPEERRYARASAA